MWNMGHDPPYIPAMFGEDSLKPKKVMIKNPQKLTDKNKNTDETLQEQKNIPIHGDVLIIHTTRHLAVRSR